MKKVMIVVIAIFSMVFLVSCDYGGGENSTEPTVGVVETERDYTEKLSEYDMMRIKTAVDYYDLRCDQVDSVIIYNDSLLIVEYKNGTVDIFQGSWQLRFYND